MAIVSFILGLVPVIPVAGSIVAIVLGLIGGNQAQDKGERGVGLAN
jgi:hypothetical protein